MHLALGVNTTLYKTHLAVMSEAVDALRFPINGRRLPPTVNLVLFIYFLSGFTAQHILPYGTVLLDDTLLFLINTVVSVPLISLMPCASCPSSFANERIQIVLSGPFMRCLYSWATPLSG